MTVIDLDVFRESRVIQELTARPLPSPDPWEDFKRPEAKRTRTPREKKCGLQCYPRQKLWKAANVWLNPETLESQSYDWWIMSRRIGKTLVFNDYRYSNSTSKHQSKVRWWLRESGHPYVSLEAPGGLQDLGSAERHYLGLIAELEAAIAKRGSREHKNQERRELIALHREKLGLIERLKKRSKTA